MSGLTRHECTVSIRAGVAGRSSGRQLLTVLSSIHRRGPERMFHVERRDARMFAQDGGRRTGAGVVAGCEGHVPRVDRSPSEVARDIWSVAPLGELDGVGGRAVSLRRSRSASSQRGMVNGLALSESAAGHHSSANGGGCHARHALRMHCPGSHRRADNAVSRGTSCGPGERRRTGSWWKLDSRAPCVSSWNVEVNTAPGSGSLRPSERCLPLCVGADVSVLSPSSGTTLRRLGDVHESRGVCGNPRDDRLRTTARRDPLPHR